MGINGKKNGNKRKRKIKVTDKEIVRNGNTVK